MNKKLLFIAIYPDREGKCPAYVDQLQTIFKEYIILHPSYDYDSEEGLKTLELLPNKDIPTDTDPWRKSAFRDFWAINQSDLLLYDFDIDPGERFIAVAALYKKNVVGVSRYMRECPIYLSGFVSCMVKSTDIVRYVENHFLLESIKN